MVRKPHHARTRAIPLKIPGPKTPRRCFLLQTSNFRVRREIHTALYLPVPCSMGCLLSVYLGISGSLTRKLTRAIGPYLTSRISHPIEEFIVCWIYLKASKIKMKSDQSCAVRCASCARAPCRSSDAFSSRVLTGSFDHTRDWR